VATSDVAPPHDSIYWFYIPCKDLLTKDKKKRIIFWNIVPLTAKQSCNKQQKTNILSSTEESSQESFEESSGEDSCDVEYFDNITVESDSSNDSDSDVGDNNSDDNDNDKTIVEMVMLSDLSDYDTTEKQTNYKKYWTSSEEEAVVAPIGFSVGNRGPLDNSSNSNLVLLLEKVMI
jgi:hypothetical protein